VQRAPGIPCSLFHFEGGASFIASGASRREIVDLYLFGYLKSGMILYVPRGTGYRE
jgi:hypothetical protein